MASPPSSRSTAGRDAPSDKRPRRRRGRRFDSSSDTDNSDGAIRYTVSDLPPDDPGPSAHADEDLNPAPPPTVFEVTLDEQRLDPDAAKVVQRLVRNGHEAYLVGGCVRDLLVGRSPKDFDVATSARPDDVRRLFRNSRIIGRRFRLVHVLFGSGKVIETATFRRSPQPDDDRDGDSLLIRNDNVFGRTDEDALRRDFTINALFYDLEKRRVLDWVGGMPDIEGRVVRTIGEPAVRFLEDPVRILRAIKFSARLDFGIAPSVYDAIVQCRGSLAMAARPRLFEELLRLMRGGAAHRSIWLAWETGVLDVLLPELAAYLSDDDDSAHEMWKLLRAVDLLVEERRAPLDDVVSFTALLYGPMREACSGEKDRVSAAHEFLEPIIDRLNVPRRIADAVRRLIALLPRLESGRVGRFGKTPLFNLSADVVLLARMARGEERRQPHRDDTEPPPADETPAAEGDLEPAPAKRRRRRRRRAPTEE